MEIINVVSSKSVSLLIKTNLAADNVFESMRMRGKEKEERLCYSLCLLTLQTVKYEPWKENNVYPNPALSLSYQSLPELDSFTANEFAKRIYPLQCNHTCSSCLLLIRVVKSLNVRYQKRGKKKSRKPGSWPAYWAWKGSLHFVSLLPPECKSWIDMFESWTSEYFVDFDPTEKEDQHQTDVTPSLLFLPSCLFHSTSSQLFSFLITACA